MPVNWNAPQPTGTPDWVPVRWEDVVPGDRVSLSPSNTIDVDRVHYNPDRPIWFYRWVGDETKPQYRADPRDFNPNHLHRLVWVDA